MSGYSRDRGSVRPVIDPLEWMMPPKRDGGQPIPPLSRRMKRAMDRLRRLAVYAFSADDRASSLFTSSSNLRVRPKSHDIPSPRQATHRIASNLRDQ